MEKKNCKKINFSWKNVNFGALKITDSFIIQYIFYRMKATAMESRMFRRMSAIFSRFSVSVNPLMCRMRICLTMVDLPDSPAPSSSRRWVALRIFLSFLRSWSICLFFFFCSSISFRCSSICFRSSSFCGSGWPITQPIRRIFFAAFVLLVVVDSDEQPPPPVEQSPPLERPGWPVAASVVVAEVDAADGFSTVTSGAAGGLLLYGGAFFSARSGSIGGGSDFVVVGGFTALLLLMLLLML